jgi:hypothetical protein
MSAEHDDYLDALVSQADDVASGKGPKKQKGPTILRQLYNWYHEHYETVVATTGDCYAVPKHGPNVGQLLDKTGGEFSRHVIAEWNNTHENTVSNYYTSMLVDWLMGESAAAIKQPVGLRALDVPADLGRPRTVVIDLGNDGGNVVSITAAGWQLNQRGPAVFRRTPSMRAIPAPLPLPHAPNDNVETRAATAAQYLDNALAELINVDVQQRHLIIGWLAAVYLGISRPILWLGGEQGTGKSTAARMFARLVDPVGEDGLRQPPTDAADALPLINSAYVGAFDNVGGVQNWFSNLLSSVVTGTDITKRALFYNADTVLMFNLRKAIIVTSIADNGGQPDMLSRVLPVNLNYVPDLERRNELDLFERFEDARPTMLAAICDLVALAIAHETTAAPSLAHTRFVPFDNTLHEIDAVTGWTTAADYLELTRQVQADVTGGEPLAVAILELLEANALSGQTQWRGTAAELLLAVKTYRPDDDARGWPANAKSLGRRLNIISPSLRAHNIDVARHKTMTGVVYTLTPQPPDMTAFITPQPPAPNGLPDI